MSSLGVMHARGGSRRIPGKNVKPLGGVALIAYVARAALASRIDRVILSTDDAEIAARAAEQGVEVPFRRPAELAEDVPSELVTLHALEWMESHEQERYDVVVTLQPTTPFVLPEHIDACLDVLEESDAACCFTARRAVEPPEWMFVTDDNGLALPLLKEAVQGNRGVFQELPPTYLPNGAAYATRSAVLRAQGRILCDPLRLIVMPAERSIDLDEPLDWLVAEVVAETHGFAPVEQVAAGARVNAFESESSNQ